MIKRSVDIRLAILDFCLSCKAEGATRGKGRNPCERSLPPYSPKPDKGIEKMTNDAALDVNEWANPYGPKIEEIDEKIQPLAREIVSEGKKIKKVIDGFQKMKAFFDVNGISQYNQRLA